MLVFVACDVVFFGCFFFFNIIQKMTIFIKNLKLVFVPFTFFSQILFLLELCLFISSSFQRG